MARRVGLLGRCGTATESCQLIGYEWKADRRDLRLDGRHWRELFGGSIGNAPKLGAYVCCGPNGYMVFRALMAALALTIGGLRLYYFPDGTFWLLYFNHWVLILAAFYFSLAAILTFAAVYSTGQPATGTPFVVTLCTAAYGMLFPAAIVSAMASGLVFYQYDTMFSTPDQGLVSGTDIASTFGIALLTWLDLVVNRQPYYASYHALLGCLLCWGFIVFSVICFFAGVTDAQGHRYIYTYLSWGTPLKAGGYVTGAKLLLMNIFLLMPLLNFVYWWLIWARRRVYTSGSKMVDYSV